MYQCSICKKEYDDPVEMAKCILTCDEIHKKEECDKQNQKLIMQEKDRIAEIQGAYDYFCELIKKFKDDFHKPIKATLSSSNLFPPFLNIFVLLNTLDLVRF